MNTTKNLNLAKKMTAFVSLVTAGAFVGLPAIAQMTSPGSSGGSQYPADCVPMSSNTQSNQSFPNQSDPRSNIDQSSAITGTNGSVTNSGAGGGMGGSAPSNTSGSTMSPRSSYSNNSMSSDRNAGYSPNGYQQGGVLGYEHASTIGGNALAFGGATTGGQARQMVEASRRFSDQAQNNAGYRSSGYTSSNQTNSSSYNSTSSTGSPINNSSYNDSYRNSNQTYNSSPGTNYNSSTMAGTTGTCPPGMMRSSQNTQTNQTPSLQQNDSNAPDFRNNRPSSGADNTQPSQTNPGVRNDVDPNTQAVPGQGGAGQVRQQDSTTAR